MNSTSMRRKELTTGQTLAIWLAIIGALSTIIVALINGWFSPHPAPDHQVLVGTGTLETNDVFVPVSSNRRAIKLYAKAECSAEVNGTMQIFVFGSTVKCKSGVYYRNTATAELLQGEYTCYEDIPAGETRTYSAIAPNCHAVARTVRLEVTL